ncbi:MAG TPA: hypothetical protein VD966_12865 [Pyrinomonadaceae bacterium]|nr:hypothetical protein [Pyrinomonadaceae bacterium]
MIKLGHSPAHRVACILALVALVAGSALPASAQRRRTRAAATLYTVQRDTTIRVRINEKISSGDARVGDRFTTTVVDPVYVRGVEVIPDGSTITGRVTSVKRAGRKSEAGTLGVEFISIRTPRGSAYPISGSLTSLEADEINADNESTVRGRSARKRNVVFIGGGAATGALIGAIAGGGKGAGVGAGVGAGLGVAGALFSKGKEAEVKSGTEFGVILNRSVSMRAASGG